MRNYPASALEDDDFLVAELHQMAETFTSDSLIFMVMKRAAHRIKQIKTSSARAQHEEYHEPPAKHPDCQFCQAKLGVTG